MPFVRTMSMEQRWQDLANLLSLPGQEGVGMHHPFAHHPHHHHHANYNGHNYGHDGRGVLLHNATLAPPMGDLNSSGPYNAASMGSSNLGSAVATSMNLTNSSEPIADSGSVFKMENPHDLMYYQNSTSEMNQTTEGFLSSILNDEDLQLMDMAMTEGMYPMRMLESNNTNNATGGGPVGHTEERLDASSDSAVSSMGSERVPSLSDGEWMETGSDSGHNTGDHYGGVDYHSSKFRPFDYSYTGRQLLNSGPSGSGDCHMPPVAQKKHHMFGKRYFQEQGSSAAPLATHRGVSLPTAPAPTPIKYEYGESGAESVVPPGFNSTMEPSCGPKMSEVKYSCSLDFIRHQTGARSLDHIHHNHTYPLPSEGSVAMVRPSHRDKAARGRKSDEDHLTRDEKRANAMNIPMPVDEIVNLPMDEFNERLSKYDLSEAQLSLIRDIRRRGKNKVAAQNCRKRKLDQINSLADEVKQMRDRKHRLLRERDYMMAERLRVKEKFSQLYRHVFQALRDPEGNHYSPYEYSLQQSADGTVVLVPRSTSNTLLDQEAPRVKHKDQTHDQHKE
ncbi:UNVERIFIED_CONTAM: hypothetical protein PYX00_007168 [Menopon gallinae]